MEDKLISNMSSEEIWLDFRKTEPPEKTLTFREILALKIMEQLLWKRFPLK